MIEKQDIPNFKDISRILLGARDFIYISPHPLLKNQISNYTLTFPSKDIISDNYTVIPHGCGTLVFSVNTGGINGSVFGPITRPSLVGGIANQSHMLLIIELQPAGLYGFTRENQKELADKIIPYEFINPRLNSLIIEALESCEDINELIARLDTLLLENLHLAYPSALAYANKIIIESTGNITSKALSASVNYSQRQLNRIFEHYMGASTKTFSRMIRINKAIRQMHNPHYSITCISDEFGFYDLPHFIHDFKSVCGMTPQEYRNNMSDFYSEIAKF